MEAAAVFLAVRPRSVSETRRRLRHLGYPHVLVDQVIGRLTEIGILDDDAFARAWGESPAAGTLQCVEKGPPAAWGSGPPDEGV